MAFCAFDEGVAGFDVTPVENMFITEYMLGAPGEYVKVYLYGLMLCYHNQERMSLTSMAKDLKAEEEEIERAFRYWERNGLVRRIGDNPVCYAYRNIKQLTLTRAQDPAQKLYNREFASAVQQALGERYHGYEDDQKIYDWIDVYELPEDVVLMLLQYEMKRSNGRFSMKIADRTAKDWAHRGVKSIEDAEKIVLIDNEREKALKRLTASLGQATLPSDDQKKMYNKWIDEWGFTSEAIEEARKETASGTPSMRFLESILAAQHQMGNHTLWEVRKGIAQRNAARDLMRKVYARLGRAGMSPTDEDLRKIDEIKAQTGYDEDMILYAAEVVHESNSKDFSDVLKKLSLWRREGYESIERAKQEQRYYESIKSKVNEIFEKMGVEKAPKKSDCSLFSKWTNEMGMSMELVLLAAEYSRGSGAPMRIADKILFDWQRAGISTAEAARAEHEAHVRTGGAARPAAAKETMQRHTYSQEDYRRMMMDLDEEES